MSNHFRALFPDADTLLALEPDELGLRMLPVLARWPSSDGLTIQSFRNLILGHDDAPADSLASAAHCPYPSAQRGEIDEAIREAWAWLEGAALLIEHPGYKFPTVVRKLSRRGRKLALESNPHRVVSARRLPKEVLHPTIREDVWALYHRGKFDTAAFTAMKSVEVAVRDAAGLQPSDLGVALMRKAFHKETGILTDLSAEEGERDARAHLFAGAIGSYKNPHSHRNVALEDPDEAAEIILLANHLLRIVDSRRRPR